MDRRGFLVRTGLALARPASRGSLTEERIAEAKPVARRSWSSIRHEFLLDPSYIHFGLLYLASHPTPVRDAIKTHRQGLDGNPVYIQDNSSQAEARVPAAAAKYLGASTADIALTDSTTMDSACSTTASTCGPARKRSRPSTTSSPRTSLCA